MKKQILSLALTLTLALSLAIPALAAETVTLTTQIIGDETTLTITGVLSQEKTSFKVAHPTAVTDENNNLLGKAEYRIEEVEDATIYTVNRDFTATSTTSRGSYNPLTSGGVGGVVGCKLLQNGTYELIGEAYNGEYCLFDYTATENEKLMRSVTEEEFFSACDLYYIDYFEWFRFSDSASVPTAPAVPTVPPSPCKGTLDGMMLTLNAYLFQENGGGANYVMLRDIAKLLNGTKAQFEVTWNKDSGIVLTTGQAYTPVGGELQSKGDGEKAYTANTSTITVDGKPVELTAYTIEGNNYFKLRDLGAALGFNVGWDGATGTVTMDSTQPYSGTN